MKVVQFPLLRVDNLHKRYPIKKLFQTVGSVKALSDVCFSMNAGETLAVVGESGCGKSTLARMILGLESPSEGSVRFLGESVSEMKSDKRLENVQMIFQDPYGSLNPRKKAWQIIAEPLRINSKLSSQECRDRAENMMARVGLRPEYSNRYPHMFSGGQRQRIGIARALMLKPRVLICDEPVSALDVSVQAQILNLLMQLQEELGVSLLFISHDLGVVRHVSDRVIVLYLGRVVEQGTVEEIFQAPSHPYTKSLLESTPTIPPRRTQRPVLSGEIASPLNPPSGCAFHTRCPVAEAQCREERPKLQSRAAHKVACHLAVSSKS